MNTNDWLIEASYIEDKYPVSVAGSNLTREQVERIRAAERLPVKPELCAQFRSVCAQQGKDEKAVLESLIGDWLSTQEAIPAPATTFAG